MANIFNGICKSCGRVYRGWSKRFCQSCLDKEERPNNSKWCSGCGTYKNTANFSKWSKSKDGLRNWCNDCHNKANKNHYKYKRERGNFYYAYQSIKRRFTHGEKLSKEQFRIWYENTPKICVYCGIPEEIWELIPYIKHWGTRSIKKLCVDRMDNNQGYEINNIVLACQMCNSTKGGILTYNEMREIGEKYIKPKWQKLIQKKQLQEVF